MFIYIPLILIFLSILYYIVKGKFIISSFICFNTYLLFPLIGDSFFLFDIFFILLFIFLIINIKKTNDFFIINKKQSSIILSFLVVLIIPCFVFFDFNVFFFVLRKIQILLLFLVLLKINYFEIDFKSLLRIFLFFFSLNLVILIFQKFNFSFFLDIKLVSNKSESGLYSDSTEFGPIFLIYLTFLITLLLNNVVKFNKLLFLLLIILTIGVVINNSRTSLLILFYPFLLLLFYFRKRLYFILPILILVVTFFIDPLLNLSSKNSSFLSDIGENGILFIFETDTFALRTINWEALLNYYSINCNPILGCGYTIEKSLEKLLISSQGVFSIDNTFVRLIFSSGYLGLLYFIYLGYKLIHKSNMILLLPVIVLLSITQEVIQSLPIILNLLLIGIISYNIFSTKIIKFNINQ